MDECATTIAVYGERDHLYALAAAVPRWADFLPHYRWTRPAAPSEDGAAADLDMACWRGWIPLRWRTTVTTDPATHRVQFVHTGGGARGMQVEWRLVEQDGTTTATITHDLRGLAQWPATTPPGRYILTRHLIEPVARRTLATMKTLVEAGATDPDTAVALAADPAGPVPARDDPRAELLSWLPWALWLGTSVVWSRWSRRTLAASGESRRREEPAGAWRGHLAAFAATFALLAPALP
ncbi:MAG TPA: SRPBCC family protein, partial [Nitrolancea sp.]|nr:SRPBCC family protein [Nitrolancea sp.]